MAEPICEDEGLLQEWTPLTQLLQQIPLKAQRGLFFQNLSLTCVNVVPEFIALGTNLGFVYWYCRATGDLQRLRFENSYCSVTCVKIMTFADYMVAAGTDQGAVIVFQIPKVKPGSTPDQIKSKQKQIQRFTINNLHQAEVTCIEWDSTEMKVFSGDKNGCVALTEINLQMHISKSMELLNEGFEIVQLNYNQHTLVVSTIHRTIICDGTNSWKVYQVGTKERKILDKLGATFCKFQHELVVFASRPGHRLWLSNKNGIVQQTLIFKSAVQSNCPKIQLINPVNKKQPFDTSFGKVIQFGDNKLITYNLDILYILHPGAVTILSVLNSARKILDVAVNENEIFILEGERSLLRISPLPDKYSLDLLCQPVSKRTSFNFDEFAAKIKDTAAESIKKITKDLIPSNEETSPNSPPALADEALELPHIVNLPSHLIPTIFTNENIEIHSSVSDDHSQNFTGSKNDPFKNSESLLCDFNNFSPFNHDWHEEVITRPLPRRHNKKSKPNLQGSDLISESESDTTSSKSGDRLVCGVANDLSLSDESAFSQSQSSFSVLRDISSLLGPQKPTPKNYEAVNNELMKTSDTKSQTSLDTCESVSERLLLNSEAFREEQERTFARLANQSLFDSFNSEKTDNMSISLNMTTSNSFSSKVIEHFLSQSCISENSGMASTANSADSQSTNNSENQTQGCWKWDNTFVEENSNQEENVKNSSGSITSIAHSQKERLYPKWARETEAMGLAAHQVAESSTRFSLNESNKFEETRDIVNPENNVYESGIFENGMLNEMSAAENRILNVSNEGKPDFSEINSLEKLKQENLQKAEVKDKAEEIKENECETKSFLLNEPLSYGPPSGSSMLGSQPSSDFSSVPVTSQISQSLVRDFTEHWLQYKTPKNIQSLAASKNYVVCTDTSNCVYFSPLPGLGLCWKLLDYKASMVRVASDGSAVWLLNKNSVLAVVNPSINSPISKTVLKIAKDIKTFALDSLNKDGLMVTLTGKIISFNKLMRNSKRLKINPEIEIACDYLVTGKDDVKVFPTQAFDIACSGGIILALSNDQTVLCKLPEEEQFKVVKTLKPVISLALGPENLLWTVDKENDIFFSDDFLSDEPHWWQIQISDYIFQKISKPVRSSCSKVSELSNDWNYFQLNGNKRNVKSSLVVTNENSVWVFNKFDSSVFVNNAGFTGYRWNAVSSVNFLPDIQWQTLCAKGVFQNRGCIWLLSLDGNIFYITPNCQVFQSIPAPSEENIICISSSQNTLWVLNERGKIYSRVGLSNASLSGTSWKEIKSPQIDNLRFTWVSCGSDVSWACDFHGRTFIMMESSCDMAKLDPTWVEVEGRPKDVQFEKVFVGSQLYMVWAIDKNQNLYVREGIFPHYQIGTGWVNVCGINAVHVTIHGAYVWALDPNGNIYRRSGVSESNFIGDYWRTIPGSLKMISNTFTDVWGINFENKIQRLNYNFKILRKEDKKFESKDIHFLKEDLGWEIVK